MTLFKKVFDNHYSEGTPQFDNQHEDDFDLEDVDDDMLFDDEASEESEAFEESESAAPEETLSLPVAKAPESETSAGGRSLAPELPSAPASVAPVAPQSRAIKPEASPSSRGPVTQPVENAEENLSLAERAAKAHALIQSQGGKTSQPLKPSGTPLKLERRITPGPDKSDVVSLHGASSAPAPKPEEASDSASRKGARVRTRLLGFHSSRHDDADPMQAPAAERAGLATIYPTGWLVITSGPGEGRSFAIQDGVSTVGRGEDQTVVLDFGDNSISRQSHAAIAYDSEQNKFFLGHGGKSNIIRLNNQPVLSTEELSHEDTIRIGETTLRFVALCGEGFKWERS